MSPVVMERLRAMGPRMTLAAVLPIALGLIAASDKVGDDVGSRLRPLLAERASC